MMHSFYFLAQNNASKSNVTPAEQSKTAPPTSQVNPAADITDSKVALNNPTQGSIETATSTAEETVITGNITDEMKSEDTKSAIKQPVIKLNRLTEEDQALLQKSLKEFVESNPNRAKDLGIELNEEDVASEEDTNRIRRAKRKAEHSDDEYQPDSFSALVSSNKKRKVVRDKTPEPVMAKPKLRRVEKKFVPVLEKLSTEELMETNTYHRFNKSIEVVLRTAEDIDASEIGRFC